MAAIEWISRLLPSGIESRAARSSPELSEALRKLPLIPTILAITRSSWHRIPARALAGGEARNLQRQRGQRTTARSAPLAGRIAARCGVPPGAQEPRRAVSRRRAQGRGLRRD